MGRYNCQPCYYGSSDRLIPCTFGYPGNSPPKGSSLGNCTVYGAYTHTAYALPYRTDPFLFKTVSYKTVPPHMIDKPVNSNDFK
ncbi:hypothetical protein M378DRAFT_171412 [Amanita muscaria Koide BX008]|uniref:Uncharacterized protein n=1 Tax=Amanita muscaria (strain Koide BX008) TaxID=946122 RepID=A0A0C2SUJ1_AMAMK|nr:hypothetical protein M378DRAFT_171412 [Amanita muscaria Koide BX008]